MFNNANLSTTQGPRFTLRGDINGLLVVVGVLIALMLLPGPCEAEYKARDVQMNDIIRLEDLK